MAFIWAKAGNDTRTDMAFVDGETEDLPGVHLTYYHTLRNPTTSARKLREIICTQVRDPFHQRDRNSSHTHTSLSPYPRQRQTSIFEIIMSCVQLRYISYTATLMQRLEQASGTCEAAEEG